MVYVQHLLGVGHLQRSLLLAAELAAQNFEVVVVSGGNPRSIRIPPGVRMVQLPPAHSPDGKFDRILDADGNAIDSAWKDRRKHQLLECFAEFAPRILITETFPFGRRMMRFELLPLLEAARNNRICNLIIASIRDVLQPKLKPGRDDEICGWIDEFYDHILVHGDPEITQLSDSFALAHRIQDKLAYSGYICAHNDTSTQGDVGNDEVLVSAGGSNTGFKILETALAARPLSKLASSTWRILVSPAIDSAKLQQLQRAADTNVIIERNRPDFSTLVKRARISISQAGYNTITDILASKTRAVVIPFAEADEIEQTLRARKLQQLGRLVILPHDELSAEQLAAALDQALDQNTTLEVDLNGAANSVDMICGWLQAARTGH